MRFNRVVLCLLISMVTHMLIEAEGARLLRE